MDTDHHERQHGGTAELAGLLSFRYFCSVLWLKTKFKKIECMPRKTAGQPSPSAHTTLFQVQQGRPRSLRLQIECRKIGSDPVLALLDSHQPARAANHTPGAELAAEPAARDAAQPRGSGLPFAIQLLVGPAHVSFWCFGACCVSREKSINASGL